MKSEFLVDATGSNDGSELFYVSQTINGKDAFETSPSIPYCYRKRLYFEPNENLWVVTKLHNGKILAYGNNWEGEGEGYGCPQDPGTEKTWYQGDFNVGKGVKMIDLEFTSDYNPIPPQPLDTRCSFSDDFVRHCHDNDNDFPMIYKEHLSAQECLR